MFNVHCLGPDKLLDQTRLGFRGKEIVNQLLAFFRSGLFAKELPPPFPLLSQVDAHEVRLGNGELF